MSNVGKFTDSNFVLDESIKAEILPTSHLMFSKFCSSCNEFLDSYPHFKAFIFQ
jgi:hypothetical protein